ncbi:unnamed protein product [Prorocentrum cordatum]|uniref:Uncharacterized protein n=1 Tax=Prorocentrum cordatum TaxID=2364126 RepID=A0ABN9U543_9DINO|nr:unnamed protein product [Polarella glacialis]
MEAVFIPMESIAISNVTIIMVGMSIFATPSWGQRRGGDGSAAGSPPTKKQVSELLPGGEDVSTVAKLRVVPTKLSLVNAADIREVTGALWNIMTADGKGIVATRMLGQGRVYYEAAKTAKNDPAAQEAPGQPYARVFAGLMQGVAEHSNLDESTMVPQADPLGKVLRCKCKPAKPKEGRPRLAKVTVAMGAEHDSLQRIWAKSLAMNGGVLKRGSAPRGPLKRAAQECGTTFQGQPSRYARRAAGVRGLLAYNREAGVTEQEYDEWLYTVHYHDLLANPALRGITLSTVLAEKPILSSGLEVGVDPATSFWRLVELHFDSLQDYRQYVEWFKSHVIPQPRTPAGRSSFRFYVLSSAEEMVRLGPAS